MEIVSNDNQTDPLPRPKPVVLLLLDGWGVAPFSEANAIGASKTPTFLHLIKEYPVALLSVGEKNLNARYFALGSGSETVSSDLKSEQTLTSVLAQAGLKQLKISETERFADLTHFFNGGAENKTIGEEWKIISSEAGNKAVKLPLAMRRTVKEIIRAIDADEPVDFIAASLPTIDLTAINGDLKVVKKAVEDVDKNLGAILDAANHHGAVVIITSAGGNAEKLHNFATDLPDKEMTDNPVPFLIFGSQFKGKTIGLADALNEDLSLLSPAGTLADVAPTILKIMGIEQPTEMSGKSLI